jgi:hypothetical protein
MSICSKQLIMNQLMLPLELVDIIKDYTFHRIKKILENDYRYNLLLTIPDKEYDPIQCLSFVYLSITEDKDYFLTYYKYNIQLQTFIYSNDDDYNDVITRIDGYSVAIE